jgi:hypothetical protein
VRSPRHIHLVIALLLPMMVLRAMLPAGYMPVTQDGTVRIAMCSDVLHIAASGAADAATDTGSDTDSSDHELPAAAENCAFATAVPGAPPPVASFSFVIVDTDAGAIQAHAAPTRSVSLVRVQSARGPPSSSL